MRSSTKITIDEAMAQMNLVSSGSSREDNSDRASFSEDYSEDAYSLDSSALGQVATSVTSISETLLLHGRIKTILPKFIYFLVLLE